MLTSGHRTSCADGTATRLRWLCELSKMVSATCLISFERNRYSIPASFANRPVSLRVYLPFSASGGPLLFHLLSKFYERASVVITTKSSFSEWATIFGDPKMTTTLLDRLTHRCHIPVTGNDTFRFTAIAALAAQK